MKKILVILLLPIVFSPPIYTRRSVAFVAKKAQASADSNGFTSSPSIDTSGANFLAVVVVNYASATAPTLSDNKSNTWNGLTAQSSSQTTSRIYYAINPTVGTGHTFTLTGSGTYCSLYAYAFSGVDTSSPFDVQNGATGNSSPLSTGSITPSASGAVLISGASGDLSINVSSIDSSFSADVINAVAGQHFSGGGAYLVHTSGAINPAWTYSGNANDTAVIAAFKASTGGGSTFPAALLRLFPRCCN